MIFKQVFDKKSSTFTYLIASSEGREALIIDPVIENVDNYIQLLNELDLKLVKVIDTHIHADHVTGASKLKDKFTFGAFLDIVSHEPEKMRKAASYLASLSEGHLIAQADFLRLSDRVGFQSFHHPLIDSEGLLKVDGLNNPSLLNHQANQLAASD